MTDHNPYHHSDQNHGLSNEIEYLPRTRLQKLTPLLIVMLGLGLFVIAHVIAGSYDSLLSGEFLIGTPFFVGAVVAYIHGYYHPTTLWGVSRSIFLVLLAIFIIAIPILREGIICMVMAAPILFIAMWVGGALMYALYRHLWKTRLLHSIALLPLLVLTLGIPKTDSTYESQASIVIAATPEQIWQQINHIEHIDSDEFYQNSWLLPLMQVPAPKSAISLQQNGRWVRKCQWHQGIYFDEPVVAYIPQRHLRWQFVFYDDSVPKGTLDDHVTINGEHFKLLWGQYDITPINATHSHLSFKFSYRIRTNINFYAGRWAMRVMEDFNQDLLTLYKNRLETPKRL